MEMEPRESGEFGIELDCSRLIGMRIDSAAWGERVAIFFFVVVVVVVEGGSDDDEVLASGNCFDLGMRWVGWVTIFLSMEE
jgi:hypothetical protein